MTLWALSTQASFYSMLCQSRRAEAVCRRALALAERAWAEGTDPAPPPGTVADVVSTLAYTELQRRELDEALRDAQRSAELYELGGSQPGMYMEFGLLELAWVHCVRGDLPRAHAILRRIEQIVSECDRAVNWQVRPKVVRPAGGAGRGAPRVCPLAA